MVTIVLSKRMREKMRVGDELAEHSFLRTGQSIPGNLFCCCYRDLRNHDLSLLSIIQRTELCTKKILKTVTSSKNIYINKFDLIIVNYIFSASV